MMSDPILMLNTDCFLDILKRLSLHDLANFKQTYKSLGGIVDMEFLRRTRGTLFFDCENEIEEALQIIRQFGSLVNDLRFDYKNLNGITWSDIFAVVNEHCNEMLTHLSLIGDTIGLIDKSDVLLIAKILGNVESFKLINWNKEYHWPKDFIEILSYCENVRDITLVSLSGIDVSETIFRMNRNLLTLQWFGIMKGSDLELIVDNLMDSQLETLILQSTKLNRFENESLIQLNRLNRLTSLCIDCNHVDIGLFLQNSDPSSSLTELSLCNCRLDESNMATLGRMTNLKALKLDTNCLLATGSHFESLLVLCGNRNFDYIQILCYDGAFDRDDYLRIVGQRIALAAEKCLSLILRHSVYAASLLEIPRELLEANIDTIRLIDEQGIGLRII